MIQAAQILNGREIAKKCLENLKKDMARINVPLKLATVRVGTAEDAALYSKAIDNFLVKVGIQHAKSEFPEEVSQDKLISEIKKLNADESVNGIMLFLPLPKKLDEQKIVQAVGFWKDVENWDPRIVRSDKRMVAPPTAEAVMVLIREAAQNLEGKEAVVVGRSKRVGLPVSILLINERATVTVCNAKTSGLEEHVKRADIVVAAVGRPNLIRGSWIKPGAIVIDVGEPLGDVEFDTAKERAGYISPVPGGVGPVTNVMLAQNIVDLYQIRKASLGNS